MADETSEKRKWLPRPNLNRKVIIKHLKKAETATIKHTHKFIIKRWSNVREVQNKVILWLIVMGLLIAATGFQMVWYQQSYLTKTNDADGTYVEAVLGPVNTLNPIFASTSAEQSANYLMFSSLLRYDKTGHLDNDLATSVKKSENSLVYTVDIRSDAKWHDGEALTAKDVAFTIELIKNPSIHSSINGWSNISVKVINDATIEFTLPSIYAAFDHMLTFPIIPEHILGDIAANSIRENEFSQNPIGSGPFKMRFVQNVDTNADRKIVYLARNDQYYSGQAKLAKVQLNVYDTTSEIIQALNQSEVNATAELTTIDMSHIEKSKYISVVKSIQSGVYAMINMKSATLNDLTLRRALQLSTNIEAIIEKLPEGSSPLDLPFTNGQISGSVPAASKYDLESAKKILNEAGWVLSGETRVKDGKELKISVVTMKGGEFEGILGVLSGQWRAAGFMVETQVVDPTNPTQNVVQNILQPRSYDVLLYRLDIGADPDVYAYWHSSQATAKGLNYSNYSNIISDNALDSARSRVEPDLRNAKYITFAKQWLADIPAIGLYQSTIQFVYKGDVNSVDDSIRLVSPIDRYSDVLNWSIGTRTVYKTP